jgi:ketosteroid isomerase-like protein
LNPSETRTALTRFYDAFARRDGAAMAALYAPDATFEDPVFRLRGEDIGRMWIALTRRARDFSISYTIAQAATDAGTVEWTARYLFGGSHPVVNVIVSEIAFADRKIVRQVDRFDFPRWAAQALGTPGRLFGRFQWFRRAVSRKAMRGIGIAPPPV